MREKRYRSDGFALPGISLEDVIWYSKTYGILRTGAVPQSSLNRCPHPTHKQGWRNGIKDPWGCPATTATSWTAILSVTICGREEQAWSPWKRFTVEEPIREGFGQE